MGYFTEWDFTGYTSNIQLGAHRFYRHAAQQIIQQQTASRTDIIQFGSIAEFNAAWEILEIEAATRRLLRKYASTSIYPLCMQLYNGCDIDIPTLTEQEYLTLATSKQEVERRKRFLGATHIFNQQDWASA